MLKKLFEISKADKISISATHKNDQTTVMIQFDDKPPLSVSGTSDQVEKGFISEIEKALNSTQKLRSSIDFFEKQLKQIEKEKKDKATGTNSKTDSQSKVDNKTEKVPGLFDTKTAVEEEKNETVEKDEEKESSSEINNSVKTDTSDKDNNSSPEHELTESNANPKN